MWIRHQPVPIEPAALAPPHAAARPTQCRWFGQRRGAVSMEFAILSVPLFVMVLGVMELGFDLFTQEVLDYAVQTAARSVQVGSAQGAAKEKSSTFVAQALCPAVKYLLNCNQIVVGVGAVSSGSNYYSNTNVITLANASSTNGSICTGTSYQLMQLQAWYIGPSFVGSLIPTFTTLYNGHYSHITNAGAGFVNEGFAGGQSGC